MALGTPFVCFWETSVQSAGLSSDPCVPWISLQSDYGVSAPWASCSNRCGHDPRATAGLPRPPLLWTPLSALTCCAGCPECPGRPTPAHSPSIFLVTASCSSCIAFPMNCRYIETLGNGLAPTPLPRLCACEDGDPTPPSVPLQASLQMRAPRA